MGSRLVVVCDQLHSCRHPSLLHQSFCALQFEVSFTIFVRWEHCEDPEEEHIHTVSSGHIALELLFLMAICLKMNWSISSSFFETLKLQAKRDWYRREHAEDNAAYPQTRVEFFKARCGFTQCKMLQAMRDMKIILSEERQTSWILTHGPLSTVFIDGTA